MSVAVLAAGVSCEEADRRVRGVLSVWPVRAAVVSTRADSLTRLRGAGEAEAFVRGADCLVVVAFGEHAAPARRRAASISREVGLACVLLCDEPGEVEADAEGVFVTLPRSADDRTVAGVLAGLNAAAASLKDAKRRGELLERVNASAGKQLEAMHEEMQAAAILQRELLPQRMPEVQGLNFAAISRASSTLSGDSFDVVQLDDEHVGVLVADASGHGIPAALTLMLVSKLLPMTEVHSSGVRILPPGEALTRLNNAFIDRRGDVHILVTAAYAVINTRTWSVRCAVAGHPAPMVVSEADLSEAVVLDAGGPPLGVVADVNYDQCERELKEGDVLAMITDGFDRALDNLCGHTQLSENDGHVRRASDDALDELPIGSYERALLHHVRAISASARHGNDAVSLEEGVERFAHELTMQTGSLHQGDDITLVALRRVRHQSAADRGVDQAAGGAMKFGRTDRHAA
ncbi:MAG: SpoIIE family protein phosphatase [Phycisphaerales bacterium]|nr:SpoIIE family protein phosphatase [Phycisphaerales bacterium]